MSSKSEMPSADGHDALAEAHARPVTAGQLPFAQAQALARSTGIPVIGCERWIGDGRIWKDPNDRG